MTFKGRRVKARLETDGCEKTGGESSLLVEVEVGGLKGGNWESAAACEIRLQIANECKVRQLLEGRSQD